MCVCVCVCSRLASSSRLANSSEQARLDQLCLICESVSHQEWICRLSGIRWTPLPHRLMVPCSAGVSVLVAISCCYTE